jgi:ABC-type sugar transport system ATPase subunit
MKPREGEPLLKIREIRKSFDRVEVLKGIDLEVFAGEVHALVGENGAGKSTLMNILAGIHQPSAGTIAFAGHEGVVLPDGKSAQRLGISIVFQERSLFEQLTIAENVFAGRQPVTKFGAIRRRNLSSATRVLLERVGLDLPTHLLVAELSPAQQQMVEIAKALSLNAKLLIFDEPTAALTLVETAALFKVIRQLKTDKVGVIYISHRLEEIFQIADRVTVLKDGAGQGTLEVNETNTDELVRLMVGRDLELQHSDAANLGSAVLFEVKGISDAEQLPQPLLEDISFSVRAGEIVGLAGLAGAGRTELALSIFGARPRGSGEVYIDGRPVKIRSPREAMAAGIGYVYEDRKDGGLFLEMSIADNIAAASLSAFGSWWMDGTREVTVANQFQRTMRIACQTVQQRVQSLSGGNQQKVALAKWLMRKPKALIVDEPTRGVDVGAKVEVHRLLYDFARQGAAVVVISSELPEILTVSDRIYVMRAGKIAGRLTRDEATEEKIMRLASLSN